MTTQGGSTSFGSPVDALHDEEVRRTRALFPSGWLIVAAVLVALWITPGDRRLASALAIALVVSAAGSAWVYVRIRDPARYRTMQMDLLALIAVACGLLGILYVGVFSAAPLVVALGLYFFCRTEHTASAIAIYAVAAGSHAIAAALVISGVIDDPGFYPVGSRVALEAQITGQVIIQFGYALVFWLARVTRGVSLRAIQGLQRATRLAAQREVQVGELRRDLDRALEIGGPGRFSGHAFGAWRLGNVMGRGGMGEVYEAVHATSGAEAAVKVLRRERLADPQHVERFFREIRVAGAIESPHVVRVLEASTAGEPLPYLVMERLRGETLGDLLRHGDTLTGGELDALVEQIGRALELARAAGVVHRDIKPYNLLRTGDGTWKVLDFGIAVLADSAGILTRGHTVGTPSYMAPEQARGQAIDSRVDTYAFGAIIYRCVTGRPPFSGPNPPAVLYRVVHEMPIRPSAIAAVSPELEAVLMVALAKSRDQRFATAAELVAAFRAAEMGRLDRDLAARARVLERLHPWSAPEPAPVPAADGGWSGVGTPTLRL